jgi:exocyst complex component 3
MDAEYSAVKLSELLRHPDDLEKIASLKSEFQRKKSAIDSQLRIGLQEQLSITQAGVNHISEGQRTIEAIKSEMQKIDKLAAEAQNMINDFPHINLVAQTQGNFSRVEEMKNNIDTFVLRLENVEQMLKADEGNLESQPNLLAVHYELTQLRDVKDAAMEQVKNHEGGQELINNLELPSGTTLQGCFDRLADSVEWFDEHVGLICINLVQLVQQGNDSLVVRLATIINEEEKNDKKARALQEAQNEYKELASRFKSITGGKKEVRGYKEKFIKAIEAFAADQLDKSNEAFEEDPDSIEKSFRWYFNDLNAVKQGMQRLMPKRWKIFQTYVQIYHKQLHDWLISRVDSPDLRPPQILAIVNWEEKYYKKMSKLGVSDEWMRPHLIDSRGQDLIREYRQLIVKTVDEWMSRMGTTDRATFKSRDENGLDTDENGCFRTKTLSDMWRMLREQIEVAKTSKRTDIMEGVVEAMFRALQARQRMWEQLVDAELAKYSEKDANSDGYQGVQDWFIAIANDQIACIDDADESEGAQSYLTRFSQEVIPLVSPEYAPKAQQQIDALREGYIDLSTHCLSTFASLILAVDFRPLLPEFFTPVWYSKKGMGQAISTFEDYLNDYRPVLHPLLQDILAEELSTELLVRYLSSVHNKGAKFKRTDPFVDKIKDDVITVFNFFGTQPCGDAVKLKWRAVESLVDLVEVEKANVPDVYESIKQSYWDVGMGWVEACLRARDDFDRSLLSSVKTRAGTVEVERGPSTVMEKVK